MKKKNSKETLKNKKPSKGDWAVISGGEEFEYALICFKNETDFHWGQGHGYCTLLENHKVVEILGKFHPKDWDELEMRFLDKYYPVKESEPIQSAGYISPTGKFYTCKSWGHRSLAKRLSAKFFRDIENPERTLEKARWIKLYDNGTIGWRCDFGIDLWEVITQKQHDTLADLEKISSGEYQDRISDYLDLIAMNKKDIS